MLKLGEKGTIIQRDKETYAIAPHIPCGVVTPAMLRKLADVAEKYKAQAMKITSASNSHYEPDPVLRFCVSGILPRLFAARKPLPQDNFGKMRIAAPAQRGLPLWD